MNRFHCVLVASHQVAGTMAMLTVKTAMTICQDSVAYQAVAPNKATSNSTAGYRAGMVVLQLLHLAIWMAQDSSGIFSYQAN